MKEKVTTKRGPITKTAAKKAAVEPFAEMVEPVKVMDVSKNPTQRRNSTAKPVKKTVRRKAKTVPVDPFAEVVVAKESSPGTVATEGVTVAAKPKAKKAVKTMSSASGNVAQAAEARPATKRTKKKAAKTPTLDVTAELAATDPAVELSPAFRALADVKLPELERENRARLQMQSPTQLYFYWSLKDNPWHQLRGVFGDDLGAYRLIVKLTDLTHDTEEIHPCEAEGNWWFAAEPGVEYQAEIGFYATNRPYFRVLYSNTITTPLRAPSPHPAGESRWTVSATKFAEVLDVSGFSRDAYDVAMAGDDVFGADKAAQIAFSRFVGSGEYALDGIAGGDIRYAMAALAGGVKLDELRWQIGERLFAVLQANTEKLSASSAQSALGEYFDMDDAEFDIDQTGPAVFGASLVHFPRNLKRRRSTEGYTPLSSHSVG